MELEEQRGKRGGSCFLMKNLQSFESGEQFSNKHQVVGIVPLFHSFIYYLLFSGSSKLECVDPG